MESSELDSMPDWARGCFKKSPKKVQKNSNQEEQEEASILSHEGGRVRGAMCSIQPMDELVPTLTCCVPAPEPSNTTVPSNTTLLFNIETPIDLPTPPDTASDTTLAEYVTEPIPSRHNSYIPKSDGERSVLRYKPMEPAPAPRNRGPVIPELGSASNALRFRPIESAPPKIETPVSRLKREYTPEAPLESPARQKAREKLIALLENERQKRIKLYDSLIALVEEEKERIAREDDRAVDSDQEVGGEDEGRAGKGEDQEDEGGKVEELGCNAEHLELDAEGRNRHQGQDQDLDFCEGW